MTGTGETGRMNKEKENRDPDPWTKESERRSGGGGQVVSRSSSEFEWCWCLSGVGGESHCLDLPRELSHFSLFRARIRLNRPVSGEFPAYRS